jgi:hypothetical protein
MNDKRCHLEDELPVEKDRAEFSFEWSPLNDLTYIIRCTKAGDKDIFVITDFLDINFQNETDDQIRPIFKFNYRKATKQEVEEYENQNERN